MATRTAGSAFAFSNAPKPVQAGRRKPVNPPAAPSDETMLNLMSDPRVVRGSMYSMYRTSTEDMGETFPAVTQKSRTRRKKKRDNIFETKPPPESREPLDMSAYLIEQPRPRDYVDEATQADSFEPLPPKAPFVPKKTGIDASTTMEEEEPFDFDYEVEPLLEVIVGKTLDVALLEVEREEELEAIRLDMEEKVAKEEADAARVKALEKASADMEAEKLARAREASAALDKEQDLARKMAARCLVSQVMPEIFEGAYTFLEERGEWVEPTTAELRRDLLPWLFSGINANLEGKELGEALMDDVLNMALEEANRSLVAEASAVDGVLGDAPAPAPAFAPTAAPLEANAPTPAAELPMTDAEQPGAVEAEAS